MKFSMILEAQVNVATTEREHESIWNIIEQAKLADELGAIDRLWLVEHHGLTQYANSTAPEVILGYLAAATSRIRLGHGVVQLPPMINHPVRVAERAATLDLLSGGRLDFGAGKGGTTIEMGAFGNDLALVNEQFEEVFPLISRMWAEDTFPGFKGQWVDIAPVEVRPRPVQQPHPPLFMACSRDDSIADAARFGVGALCLGFAGPEDVAP